MEQRRGQKIKQIANDRLKPNRINNHIKCKWSKPPLKGRDFQVGFKKTQIYALYENHNLNIRHIHIKSTEKDTPC